MFGVGTLLFGVGTLVFGVGTPEFAAGALAEVAGAAEVMNGERVTKAPARNRIRVVFMDGLHP